MSDPERAPCQTRESAAEREIPATECDVYDPPGVELRGQHHGAHGVGIGGWIACAEFQVPHGNGGADSGAQSRMARIYLIEPLLGEHVERLAKTEEQRKRRD